MGELSVSITKGIRSACISPERKIINSNITITLHPLMVASWKKPGVSSPRLPWRVGRTFTCAFPDFWESSHAFESWFRWSTWAKQEREVSEYERTIKRGVGCTRSTYFTFVHLEVGQQETAKTAKQDVCLIALYPGLKSNVCVGSRLLDLILAVVRGQWRQPGPGFNMNAG